MNLKKSRFIIIWLKKIEVFFQKNRGLFLEKNRGLFFVNRPLQGFNPLTRVYWKIRVRSLVEVCSKFLLNFFTKHCKIHGFVYFKLRMKLRMAHSKFRRSFEQTSKAFFWTMIRDINQHHELLKSLSVSDRKSFKCLSKHRSIL